MGHHEKMWLEQYRDSEILFYQRYVEDTSCLFCLEHDANLFFIFIKSDFLFSATVAAFPMSFNKFDDNKQLDKKRVIV